MGTRCITELEPCADEGASRVDRAEHGELALPAAARGTPGDVLLTLLVDGPLSYEGLASAAAGRMTRKAFAAEITRLALAGHVVATTEGIAARTQPAPTRRGSRQPGGGTGRADG